MGVKYAVNETFFDSWSHEMAYCLGFWYADGSVEYAPEMRGKYIRAACTDKTVIEAIKMMLSSEHRIVVTKKGGNYKPFYLLRIGSAPLFRQLQTLGVTERKSRTIKFPEVPDSYLSDFIRGYFDGDGCVYIEKDNNRNMKRLSTIFTCGNENFLTDLQVLLHQHALTTSDNKIHMTKGGFSGAYQLRYSTRDSLRLYNFLYPKALQKHLYLERKRKTFLEYKIEK